jgi:putative copper resistance protein D
VTTITLALAVSRLVHYASLMLMFGSSTLLAGLHSTSLGVLTARRLRFMQSVAAVLVTFSLLAWLPLESATIGDSWSSAVDRDAWSAIVLQTGFGHVWDVRMVLAAITSCVAVFAPRIAQGVIATCSGILLGLIGLTGHAAMQEGMIGWLHRCGDAVHLLCAGAWLGSLIPFFWLLRAVRDPAHRAEAAVALRMFSERGHVAVAGVLLSGSLNTWLVLGHWPVHWNSPYQVLLAMKILLTGVMVALAISNRYRWVPAMKSDADTATRAIYRRTVTGLALGVGCLALVSLFGLLEPH